MNLINIILKSVIFLKRLYNNIRMNKKNLITICIIVLLASFLFTSNAVNAASCEGVDTLIISCADDESGIGHILSLIINIASIGVGILAVIGITIVGIQYLTAGGNEEQTRKAKRRMFEIIIGIIVYVLIGALLQWLLPAESLDPTDLPHFENHTEDTSPQPNPNPSPDPSPDPEPTYGPINTQKCKTALGVTASDYAHINTYNLYVPSNVKSGMPLLLYLHGGGATSDFSYYKLNNQTSFISIAPVSYYNGWTGNWIGGQGYRNGQIINDDRIKEVKSLVDKVVEDCQIDTNRIYIMGSSNGAAGVWYMVYSYPNFFAAAIPVSGYEGPSNAFLPGFNYVTNGNLKNFANTKIVGLTGPEAGDPYRDEMCTLVKKINDNNGHARLVTMKGSNHDSIRGDIGNQSQSLYQWLIKQTKGSKSSWFKTNEQCIDIPTSNFSRIFQEL